MHGWIGTASTAISPSLGHGLTLLAIKQHMIYDAVLRGISFISNIPTRISPFTSATLYRPRASSSLRISSYIVPGWIMSYCSLATITHHNCVEKE